MLVNGLAARDVEVYLPSNYSINKKTQFPVLYLQDGENMFDTFNKDNQSSLHFNKIADELIHKKEIKPLIMVAIHSSNNRNIEYSPSEDFELYSQFILKQLKPFIDARYRTLSGKRNTAIGGVSLGGLSSFMMAWNHPDVFSNVITFSPVFGIGTNSVSSYLNSQEKTPKHFTIYADCGDSGYDEKLNPILLKMLDFLNKNENILRIHSIYGSI